MIECNVACTYHTWSHCNEEILPSLKRKQPGRSWGWHGQKQKRGTWLPSYWSLGHGNLRLRICSSQKLPTGVSWNHLNPPRFLARFSMIFWHRLWRSLHLWLRGFAVRRVALLCSFGPWRWVLVTKLHHWTHGDQNMSTVLAMTWCKGGRATAGISPPCAFCSSWSGSSTLPYLAIAGFRSQAFQRQAYCSSRVDWYAWVILHEPSKIVTG